MSLRWGVHTSHCPPYSINGLGQLAGRPKSGFPTKTSSLSDDGRLVIGPQIEDLIDSALAILEKNCRIKECDDFVPVMADSIQAV